MPPSLSFTFLQVRVCLMMRSPKRPAKLAMLFLLALLLLCDAVGKVHGKTIHENSVDLDALLDFKKGITKDPRGALSNWNTTTHHFCRWNGVICTTTPPFRVSWLNLTGQNLQGQISSSLGNLTFLNTLDLSNNSFLGGIPLLGNLKELQALYLWSNQLQGIIPDALANCTNLTDLDLSINHLEGAIPQKLETLSNLLFLNLAENNLSGTIPPALGNITTLESLDLSSNNFTGQVPTTLGMLSKLSFLHLQDNNLEARDSQGWAFLHALKNCTLLQTLSLSENQLQGEIPNSIGDLSLNLQTLALGENMLSGAIPPSIGNLHGLTKLLLGFNNLAGTIAD
jgi:Leucine-rich repeat (LRR) protein